jgi:hypothetical protein
MINSSNINTYEVYDTKFKDHNINNENNEVQHKGKRFNLNFDFFFLELIKIHPKWLPQEIALAFIQKYPYLNLNTSQIECHFKYIKCISKKTMIMKFIFKK